jgi:hypothetical protein
LVLYRVFEYAGEVMRVSEEFSASVAQKEAHASPLFRLQESQQTHQSTGFSEIQGTISQQFSVVVSPLSAPISLLFLGVCYD